MSATTDKLRAEGKRHGLDRPLAKLTEDELMALDVLGRHTTFLAVSLRAPLDDLSALAARELDERDR